LRGCNARRELRGTLKPEKGFFRVFLAKTNNPTVYQTHGAIPPRKLRRVRDDYAMVARSRKILFVTRRNGGERQAKKQRR
jgi:hypothetical protein